MMRVFKPKYKDRTGKYRETEKWYLDFADHHEIRRRIPAFTDKVQSERLGVKIEKLVVCRQNHEPPDKYLTAWLDSLPKRLLDLFVKFDLLDSHKGQMHKALSEHLEDFRKSLQVGTTKKHVTTTCARIEAVLDGCGFRYYSDITGSTVQQYLAGLDIATMTSNYYLTCIRQFCRWMVADRRAAISPVEYLKRLRTPQHEHRRALTEDEVVRLLTATEKAPTHYHMSGPERVMLYLLTVETGLRVSELQRLKVSDFDFDNATMMVKGDPNRKQKDTVEQLLKHSRAAQLRDFFAGKEPGDKAFNMPSSSRTAPMLKRDLEVAEIDYIDAAGRKADFHCLRHTLATLLDKGGASLKERMTIMRHSDRANMTLGVYTHVQTYDIRRVIENLPDCFAICFAKLGAKLCKPVQASA